MYCKNGDIYLLYSYANLPSPNTSSYDSKTNFFKGGVIVITSSGSSVITLDENYAPQKIIAIKPKELVIIVEGFVINANDVTNLNKVFTFDLASNSFAEIPEAISETSANDYDFSYNFYGTLSSFYYYK